MAKRNTAGRPKGSANKEVDHALAKPTRCPRCESTERERYYNKIEQDYAGTHDGETFTHIIRRRTKCKNCGQHRIDRSYENRTGEGTEAV